MWTLDTTGRPRCSAGTTLVAVSGQLFLRGCKTESSTRASEIALSVLSNRPYLSNNYQPDFETRHKIMSG
jgi:hypothetical protein